MIAFLHGFLGTKEDWQPLFSCLSSKISYFAIDLPGHGTAPFSTDIIGTVKKKLDSLGTRHLIGYSAGGRLALILKALFPKTLDYTIVLSGHPGIADPEERAIRLQQDQDLAKRLRALPIQEFIDLWYAQAIFASLRKKESLFHAVTKKRLLQNPIALSFFLETFSTGLFSPPKLYPNTLFLHGDEDLKYQALYRILPSFVTVQCVRGSGHVLPLENPRGCADAIMRFIKCELARGETIH